MKAILFVLDTLRADHLSGYGYYRSTSPVLDSLMAQGTCFLNCSSAFSCTLPSFTSIVTGKFCANHKMVINPAFSPNQRVMALDDTTPTLAELLWDQGYVTAAFDNLINFKSHPSWFVRGFAYHINVTGSPQPKHHHIRADDLNARLLPWLREHAREDFFVFAHYWDPHQPYNAPEPYDSMYLSSELTTKSAFSGESYAEWAGPLALLGEAERAKLARYDGEINYVDDRIGQVLETLRTLGIADETAILVTSDHGEIMVERDMHFEHRGVWHPTMHVPLIVYSPNIRHEAPRSEAYVHHVDILPTILDLTGFDAPPNLDGLALRPIMEGKAQQAHPYQFGEGTYRGIPQRCFQQDSWKLIRNYNEWAEDTSVAREPQRQPYGTPWLDAPDLELYDLAVDPEETVNLAAEQPQRAQELAQGLDAYLASILDDPQSEDAFALRRDVTKGTRLWRD
jgi:arylsulfatase